MSYDLMLLADPGVDRAELLRVLGDAPDVRSDLSLGTRFWLTTARGEAPVDIGTKDPVGSVHVELAADRPAEMEAAVRRTLELAELLQMRVEDVQWGHEVTPENVPGLLEHWTEQAGRRSGTATPAGAANSRPWWRFW